MTVFESMIIEEYDREQRYLAALERELAMLPKGSLVEKRRGNRSYHYLTYREGNRVLTKYVPVDQVEHTRAQIERRGQMERSAKVAKKTMLQITRALGCEPDEFLRNEGIR